MGEHGWREKLGSITGEYCRRAFLEGGAGLCCGPCFSARQGPHNLSHRVLFLITISRQRA